MSLAKLSNQLKRDLKKNPKKAGMLVLLAAVAVWFWAPLVLKSGDEPAGTTGPATAAATANMPATVPSPLTAQAQPLPPWQDLAAWIEADVKMQPTELDSVMGDRPSPFAPGPEKVARLLAAKKAEELEKLRAKQAEEVAKTIEPMQVLIDPKTLGIVVNSTIVGSARRSARINGRTYVPGEAFEIAGVKLRVVDIEAGGVVLEHGVEKFEVAIRRGFAD